MKIVFFFTALLLFACSYKTKKINIELSAYNYAPISVEIPFLRKNDTLFMAYSNLGIRYQSYNKIDFFSKDTFSISKAKISNKAKNIFIDITVHNKELIPTITFGGKSSGSYLKLTQLKNKTLQAEVLNLDLQINYKIVSFTIMSYHKKGINSYFCEGSYLSEDVYNSLFVLDGLDHLIFKNICIEHLDGDKYLLKPYILFIQQ